MKCPSCDHTLVESHAGDIAVEICKSGCGGIWFDRDELFRFDEPHEFDVGLLLDIIEHRQIHKVDHDRLRHCPKCVHEPLVRQFFDINNEVEFDQCWSCAGVWLDPGEIDTIRKQFATHEDRVKASNAYLVDELSRIYESMQEESRQHLEELQQKYDRNPLARAMGFFQRLIGVEDRTHSLLDEQIFTADFKKLK